MCVCVCVKSVLALNSRICILVDKKIVMCCADNIQLYDICEYLWLPMEHNKPFNNSFIYSCSCIYTYMLSVQVSNTVCRPQEQKQKHGVSRSPQPFGNDDSDSDDAAYTNSFTKDISFYEGPEEAAKVSTIYSNLLY